MKRIVLITGASRGLGLSLAKRFLQTGDYVFGASRSRRYWKKAFDEVEHSKRFRLRKVDLTQPRQVQNWIRQITKKYAKIDILAHCAGRVEALNRLEHISYKEFRKIIQANLTSTFLLSQAVLPIMRKKKRGWILHVSSMAGKRAVPRVAAYSASKFGVVALSQAIAKENEDTRIKCVTVCPGGMNTKMRADLFGREDAEKQQSADFVADVMMQIVQGQIKMNSGDDIVIRYGKITAINPLPGR